MIIDQETLEPGIFMGALAARPHQVTQEVNRALLKPRHVLHVHNTNTAAGDKEMEKSLFLLRGAPGQSGFRPGGQQGISR